MPTFVYMTRCDGCGHCVDICPSDIMHIDKTTRRAYNIEPNMCWECYSCVKACPQNAIDVRGYADFAPMGHSVRTLREEEILAFVSTYGTNPGEPLNIDIFTSAGSLKTPRCILPVLQQRDRPTPSADAALTTYPYFASAVHAWIWTFSLSWYAGGLSQETYTNIIAVFGI